MSARGDFEAFVHGSSTRLLRTAYLLSGDRNDAEDLLQMTLMRVARRWPVAEAAPGPYAHRVLVNLSRDRARRAGRRVREVEASSDELGAPRIADRDLGEEIARRQLITAALSRLPRRQREVLILRFYADLSVAECAAATGASEGTVKSHTSRALARMRELLAEPTPVEVSPDER